MEPSLTQCCGSGMLIPDPNFLSRIQVPGPYLTVGIAVCGFSVGGNREGWAAQQHDAGRVLGLRRAEPEHGVTFVPRKSLIGIANIFFVGGLFFLKLNLFLPLVG